MLVSFLQYVRGGVTTAARVWVCVCVCVCDGLCMVAVQLYLRAEHVVFGSDSSPHAPLPIAHVSLLTQSVFRHILILRLYLADSTHTRACAFTLVCFVCSPLFQTASKQQAFYTTYDPVQQFRFSR